MFWSEIEEILMSMLGLSEYFHEVIHINCSNNVSIKIVNRFIGEKRGSEWLEQYQDTIDTRQINKTIVFPFQHQKFCFHVFCFKFKFLLYFRMCIFGISAELHSLSPPVCGITV